MGVRVGVAIFFLLWALEWACQIFFLIMWAVRVGVANFFFKRYGRYSGRGKFF